MHIFEWKRLSKQSTLKVTNMSLYTKKTNKNLQLSHKDICGPAVLVRADFTGKFYRNRLLEYGYLNNMNQPNSNTKMCL